MVSMNNNWKKIVSVVLVLSLFLVVVGCFNYKDTKSMQPSDAQIVSEIAKVEQEVSVKAAAAAPETKLEEVKAEEKTAVQNVSTEKTVEEKVSVEKPTEEKAAEKKDDSSSEMQTVTVKESEKVKLVAQLNDPDKDPINFTYSKPLNTLGEWKTNYGDAGEYVTTLTATDGKLTATKKVKVIVQRVNVPPKIETVSSLIVNEGETVKLEPKVEDPNGDKFTITVSEPLKNGVFKTDHTSAGEYDVKITATDGELTSEKTFKLTVKDVNMPPTISGLGDLTVKEGELVTFKPVVADLDATDTVKVTISNPVGDDGVWQTSYTDHGDYTVTVTADDGKVKVSKTVKLTVQDVNMPPEIVKVSLQK